MSLLHRGMILVEIVIHKKIQRNYIVYGNIKRLLQAAVGVLSIFYVDKKGLQGVDFK